MTEPEHSLGSWTIDEDWPSRLALIETPNDDQWAKASGRGGEEETRAVECAEGDLLGELLEALRDVTRYLDAIRQKGKWDDLTTAATLVTRAKLAIDKATGAKP